jgi:hypothetical protein
LFFPISSSSSSSSSTSSAPSSRAAAPAAAVDVKPLPLPLQPLGLTDARACAQCGEATTRRCAKCQTAAYCAEACETAAWGAHMDACEAHATAAAAAIAPPLATPDLIICTTEERTAIMAAAAKELHLPYVRFDAVFIEGSMVYNYECERQPAGIILQPAWVSVGDYGNLLYVRGVFHRGEQDKVVPHEHPLRVIASKARRYRGAREAPAPLSAAKEAAISVPGRAVRFVDDSGEGDTSKDGEEVLVDSDDSEAYWLALKFAFRSGRRAATGPATMSDVVDVLLGDEGKFCGLRFAATALPGGNDYGAPAPPSGGAPGPATRFFHVDSTGATCFSQAEAAATSQLLVDTAFLASVQTRIRTTPFILPQHGHEKDVHFCNESVYGHTNMIRVSGLVRLDTIAAERAAAGAAAAALALMLAQDAAAVPEAKAAAIVEAGEQEVDENGRWQG